MNLSRSADSKLEKAIASVLDGSPGLEDPFFILDFDKIIQVYSIWKKLLPRVKPFYAIKCNPNSLLVGVLAALGTGFDCASKGEINQILSLGVSPKAIIFANTVKYPSHITFAKTTGVETMTFDTMEELSKIADLYPSAKLILRIKSTENDSRHSLSNKFGASMSGVSDLLIEVKRLNLNIVGVSFHVGNYAFSGAPYETCIQEARKVFDIALEFGFRLKFLDIGGGFSSVTENGVLFSNIATAITNAIETYFPIETNVEIIAEPGAYFAQAAFTLVANVILKKMSPCVTHLYLSDGIYGTLRDNTDGELRTLFQPHLRGNRENKQRRTLVRTKFWGPTGDSADVLSDVMLFPETRTGEWVIVPNWGAYTLAEASVGFNGMPMSEVKGYLVSNEVMELLPNLELWSSLGLKHAKSLSVD